MNKKKITQFTDELQQLLKRHNVELFEQFDRTLGGTCTFVREASPDAKQRVDALKRSNGYILLFQDDR